MKTYLPQIDRRILVRPNQTFGILTTIWITPTRNACWNWLANRQPLKIAGTSGPSLLAAMALKKLRLGKQIINSKGLTLAKLLKAIATDKALFSGFGIHVNYNANFKITSVNYVKFEDIRMGDTDNPETAGKFAIYNDWGRKTWKNIMRSKITFLDKYSPDEEAIVQQQVDRQPADGINTKDSYFTLTPKLMITLDRSRLCLGGF
jgi:hypothetical protein